MNETYIVWDANAVRWFFYAKIPYGVTDDPPVVMFADGSTAEPEHTLRPDWWTCEQRPVALFAAMKPAVRTVGWRLPEGTVVQGYPGEVTPDEMADLREAEGLDECDAACGTLSLYQAVTEETERPPHIVDFAEALELRERGPHDVQIPAGARWKMKMTAELSQRAEYGWLMPGHLTNIAEALAARLEKHPGAKAVYSHRGFTLFPKFGGKNDRLGIPPRIAGRNLADAVEQFEALLERVTIESGAARQSCPTCEGRGYTNEQEQ